jgi:hypothetical protein
VSFQWVGAAGAGLTAVGFLLAYLPELPVEARLMGVLGLVLIGVGVRRSLAVRVGGDLWKLVWMGHYGLAGVTVGWMLLVHTLEPQPLMFFSVLVAVVLAAALFQLGRELDEPVVLAAAAAQLIALLPALMLLGVEVGVRGALMQLLSDALPAANAGRALLLALVFVRWGGGPGPP